MSGKVAPKKAKRTPKVHTAAHPKKAALLAAISETGNVLRACIAAGVSRRVHYNWIADDAEYQVAFAEAMDEAADRLEEEARRRAHEGVDEPVFYQGEVCGTVRKYSDTLLIFLMKGARPDKYRDNAKVEHSGGIDLQVSVTVAEA